MGLFPVGTFGGSREKSDSWLQRVADNLRLAFRGVKIPSSFVSGNNAPVHFDMIDLSRRNGRAQTFSACLHLAILGALLFAVALTSKPGPHPFPITGISGGKLLPYIRHLDPQSTGQPSLGGMGSGGEQELKPARFGNLAPRSSMPLAPPRLIRRDNVELPVAPAVFDPNAPASVTTVMHLGLPWMNGDTDSAGPGKGHGFGSGEGDSMGDGHNRSGAGEGEDGAPYANVVSPVACLYCPEPGYTEEAREAKLQGKMLLQVLVGTDGKARQIRILQGLGLGLDERAVETVRGWRFAPGRDANRRPVSAWVTVETHFQLF